MEGVGVITHMNPTPSPADFHALFRFAQQELRPVEEQLEWYYAELRESSQGEDGGSGIVQGVSEPASASGASEPTQLQSLMRRFHRKTEELSREEMDELLSSSDVGRLGLSVENKPYVVPASCWYRSGTVYFHSGEGKKVDYMTANSRVCVQVDRVAEDGSWWSIIIYGNVVLSRDPKDRMAVFRKIFGKELHENMARAMRAMRQMKQQTAGKTGKGGAYVGWIDVEEMTGRRST